MLLRDSEIFRDLILDSNLDRHFRERYKFLILVFSFSRIHLLVFYPSKNKNKKKEKKKIERENYEKAGILAAILPRKCTY